MGRASAIPKSSSDDFASGPASAFGVFGETQVAFFKMINDNGGINGRKVDLISLDNAFRRPKRSNRRANSWKATAYSLSPARWARRPTRRSPNI